MKKFFEEYGAVAIIVIVIAVLLLIVGSVKGLDEGTGKVNGSGVASIVGNAYSNAIDKFKDSFDNVLTGNSDNSTKTLVSKNESQVGKYADVDGDGIVDGVIFADLMIGGSGEYGTNGYGGYTITKISSCKDYYVSQNSYTNKIGGTAEVLTPIGNGNDRFYVMALNDIDLNSHDWYNAANSKINDHKTLTNEKFGNGKNNTTTMISKWNVEVYGSKNSCLDHTDLWNEIQTQAGNGWFVPSSAEWSAFGTNLGLTRSNYSSKGLKAYYWTSSLRNVSYAYTFNLNSEYIDYSIINSSDYVRLATTF